MIKWVVCDLDNTLLTGDKRLSPKTLEVLASLRDKGIAVGLATGRAYELAKPYAQAIQTDLPLILNNGALTKTLKGAVLSASHLKPEVFRPLITYANEHGYPVTFHAEEGFYTEDPERLAFYDAWNQRHKDAAVSVHALNRLHDTQRVYKMLMVIDDPSRMTATLEQFRHHPNCHITRSQHNFLDVLPPDTSKGEALLVLLKGANIKPEEIIVFGDEDNDVEMLQLSPHSYAMPNASNNAKEAACHLAFDDHDADGVAKTLASWLKRL
ncbi:MAG: HAD family hydrolase [Acholeplasmatales bacterium]|nr:MAG: HAD family hydrolase [Acholeplasmatales bacterium]